MATTVETFANQPTTTVTAGGTTAPASGTSESWTVTSSASFPAASNAATPPTQFHVADTATGKSGEIIAVTNVSGTTWTVTRGAESSTTVAHTAGFTIVQVVSAAALGGLLQSASNLSDVASAATSRTNLGLTGAATATLPLSLANGGTGQATQQAALDALAGAVTANQVLGGNGTHVILRALAAADLPAATTSLQGAVVLDGTATDIQPDGTQAAGATGKAADAGHVHPFQAWQFRPESYGAKGDGIVCTVSTTATSTTITATSAVFTSTAVDGGKHIMIHGADGSTSGPLLTTISTVTNPTTAVLAAAPSATVSACPAVFGTDDTAAMVSCVTAAGTYATAHSYFAEVVFAAKTYVLASGPTQTGNGSTTPTFNSQIPLPYPAANGTSQKLVIALTGAGRVDHLQFWESTTPNVAGTALMSLVTAPAPPDATFGRQSVIGGPSAAAGFTGGYANVKPVITGITVFCGAYTNETGFDLTYVAGCHVDGCSAHIFAPTGVNGGAQPYLKDLPVQASFQATWSIGGRFPAVGNNADVTVPSFTAEGYLTGLYVADFFTGGQIRTNYTYRSVMVDLTSGLSATSHLISIASLVAEAYQVGIASNGGGGGIAPLDISMDAECTGVVADISDASSTFYGVVRWTDPADARTPTVSGAANLRVINDKLGPGHWAGAPAAPASTASQQNTAWRDAWITLSATTGITVISVDGTTTGLTAGNAVSVAIRVAAGKSYAVTYGGVLTTTWWLD